MLSLQKQFAGTLNYMKILITGASGFVGSFLVEEALNRGFEVWAGIRKSSSKRYLQDNRIQFIDLHYADMDKLKNQLTGFQSKFGKWDYIVHNAGVTKCKDKRDFDTINYQYTRNLADALIACEMLPEKFILISSLSAWGPVKEASGLPIMLNDLPNPDTKYGKSKLKAETYLRNLPHFPYIILRPTGIYGPRDKDYFLMFKAVKQGVEFLVGRKPQYITFVYVKDLVKVVFLAMEKGVAAKSYFVSDGQTYSAIDFSSCIQRESGKKHLIRLTVPLGLVKFVCLACEKTAGLFGKTATLNSDKYNIFKQRNWMCDIADLENDLGYTADYDLEKGVKETFAWYKEEMWL